MLKGVLYNMKRLMKMFLERKRFIAFSVLKLLIMIISLVVNIIIIRKLSVKEYGIYSVAFMLIGLITTFGFTWSSTSIIFFGSKEKAQYGNLNKTFWARNIIMILSILILTLLFVVFRDAVNSYVGIKVSYLILIWLYVSVYEDYLCQYFLAVERQVLSAIMSITSKLIFLILIALLPFNVENLIRLNIISNLTVILYTYSISKKDIGKFEFDRNYFKKILNFSLWQLFGYSGLYLINFGDTAVIKYFMTMEDVGVYNSAYRLFNAAAGFAFIIPSFYASRVSIYFENKEYSKIKSFYYRDRVLIFIVSTLIHIIVMLYATPIIKLLYGSQYIAAAKVLNILLIGSIFRYLSVFYTLYYNISGKHKILQLINIATAVLNVVLDVVFIKRFGILGPAYATVISLILALVFSIYYCERKILHIGS